MAKTPIKDPVNAMRQAVAKQKPKAQVVSNTVDFKTNDTGTAQLTPAASRNSYSMKSEDAARAMLAEKLKADKAADRKPGAPKEGSKADNARDLAAAKKTSGKK